MQKAQDFKGNWHTGYIFSEGIKELIYYMVEVPVDTTQKVFPRIMINPDTIEDINDN